MAMQQIIDRLLNNEIVGTYGTSHGYVATAATTSVVIRATTYTAPGTNAQRSISSSNVNDTSAGTGARTVKITYFDNTCAGPFTETVTLNGTTAVNTVSTTMALIEKIEVMTVGSGGGNAGTITLFVGINGGGGTIGTVMIGDNKTFWGHHYVAVNHICYVPGYRGSATVAAGQVTLNVLNPINGNIAQLNVAGTLRHSTTTIAITFDMPILVTGPAIIFANEKPDVATASTAFGSFDFVELS